MLNARGSRPSAWGIIMDWRNRIYSSIGFSLQCAKKDLQDGERIYQAHGHFTGCYIRCKPDSELLELIRLFVDVEEI